MDWWILRQASTLLSLSLTVYLSLTITRLLKHHQHILQRCKCWKSRHSWPNWFHKSQKEKKWWNDLGQQYNTTKFTFTIRTLLTWNELKCLNSTSEMVTFVDHCHPRNSRNCWLFNSLFTSWLSAKKFCTRLTGQNTSAWSTVRSLTHLVCSILKNIQINVSIKEKENSDFKPGQMEPA